jgi:hypothetical protein
MTADVLVEAHGSLFLLRPLTPQAQAWVDAHVALEGWQWLGRAFAVEGRYLSDLLTGMEGDGLTVAVQ